MLSNAKLAKILEMIEKKSKQPTHVHGDADTPPYIPKEESYSCGIDDGEICFARELQNIVDGPEPASVINA